MECEPTVRPLSVKTAAPETFTLITLSCVAPSKNVTVPSGDPVGTGEIVAINETVWPVETGFGSADNAVVVSVGLAGDMTSVTGPEVEVAKPVFPE
jgi:hypothetical protein